MTVSAETFHISYTTSGFVNETFPTTFVFHDASELFVFLNGALQSIGTNYSVTGGEGATGAIVWNGTPSAGLTLLIIRRHPTIQTSDYRENDPFPAEAHEDALDRLATAAQASLRLSASDPRIYDAGQGGGTTRRIANVSNPTAAQDAATKVYVDSLALAATDLPPITAPDVGKFLKAASDAPDVWNYDAPLPHIQQSAPGGGDIGKVLTVTGAGASAFQSLPAPVGATFPYNFVINGQFQISQRAGIGGTHASGSAFPNNNAAYTLDRWVLQSDGNNVVTVTQDGSNPPAGAQYAVKLEVVTINKKFGIATIIENALVRRIRALGTSTVVSLRYKHRSPAANPLSKLRVRVVSWTSTADAPTRNLVTAAQWQASGTDPTPASSWVYEGSSSNEVTLADAWTEAVIQNIPIDETNCNNMAVFFWIDDTNAAVGDILYLADVQLEVGALSNAIIPADLATEQVKCERYFQTVAATAASDAMRASGVAASDTDARMAFSLRTIMRTDPTITFSAVGDFQLRSDGINTSLLTITAGATSRDSARIIVTCTADPAMTDGEGVYLEAQTANARIYADADI